MHAEGVRVRLITSTLINLPHSRLLCARWEGLREGEPCETLPSLINSHAEGVPVALNRLYLKITTPFQAIMCASGGS